MATADSNRFGFLPPSQPLAIKVQRLVIVPQLRGKDVRSLPAEITQPMGDPRLKKSGVKEHPTEISTPSSPISAF